jgi:hypothetical protein
MKIDIDKAFVTLESESNLDVFFIGEFAMDIKEKNLKCSVTVGSTDGSSATLKIKPEDFISYLIKKLEK